MRSPAFGIDDMPGPLAIAGRVAADFAPSVAGADGVTSTPTIGLQGCGRARRILARCAPPVVCSPPQLDDRGVVWTTTRPGTRTLIHVYDLVTHRTRALRPPPALHDVVLVGHHLYASAAGHLWRRTEQSS